MEKSMGAMRSHEISQADLFIRRIVSRIEGTQLSGAVVGDVGVVTGPCGMCHVLDATSGQALARWLTQEAFPAVSLEACEASGVGDTSGG
jgi:hypothetical protein